MCFKNSSSIHCVNKTLGATKYYKNNNRNNLSPMNGEEKIHDYLLQ